MEPQAPPPREAELVRDARTGRERRRATRISELSTPFDFIPISYKLPTATRNVLSELVARMEAGDADDRLRIANTLLHLINLVD